jgi:predicted nicotinamide N-methyase
MEEKEQVEKKDLFLSDIHVETGSCFDPKTQHTTRIEYLLPKIDPHVTVNHVKQSIQRDSDGDLDITSRIEKSKNVLFIRHKMQTTIDQVGYQLWRATFFLADFLLQNHQHVLEGKYAVELGAGLGFVSLICSQYTKHFYATDMEEIIKQAELNWSLNTNDSQNERDKLRFKELNWSNYETFLLPREVQNSPNAYNLSKFDLDLFEKTDVLLAADVVYDDILTNKLMNTIYRLMTFGERKRKVCLIANEKRINFNIHSLCVTDTAYDYFVQCLNDLNEYEDIERGYSFKTHLIDTNHLPKYVCNYKRNDYLSIWQIECIPMSRAE